MTTKYSVDEIERTGKPARFRSLGGERDGWIMPDGWGVDYAGFAQVTFDPKNICNIRYEQPEVGMQIQA